LRAVVRDWSFDNMIRARSSTPVNVLIGSDPLNIGLTTIVRPDLVPNVPLYIESAVYPGGRRINPDAFRAPAPSRQGTLGRNVIRGLSMAQLDFAARRQFAVTDRLQMQFRAELFNITNHPNFGDPSGTLLSGAAVNPVFGISQTMLGRSLGSASAGFNPLFQAGGPRSIQFALKLMF
jgi:hypothetical protein